MQSKGDVLGVQIGSVLLCIYRFRKAWLKLETCCIMKRSTRSLTPRVKRINFVIQTLRQKPRFIGVGCTHGMSDVVV